MNTAEEKAAHSGQAETQQTPENGPPVDVAAHARPLKLRSLGAEFSEDHHEVYLGTLKYAIEHEPKMRNIAITGAYGTGKSSVLGEISRLYSDRVLELSLSTVNPDEEEFDTGLEGNPVSITKTNRIQKEIVKQILYRDAPWRTRGSRFRRISRFRRSREIGMATGVGGIVLLLL